MTELINYLKDVNDKIKTDKDLLRYIKLFKSGKTEILDLYKCTDCGETDKTKKFGTCYIRCISCTSKKNNEKLKEKGYYKEYYNKNKPLEPLEIIP